MRVAFVLQPWDEGWVPPYDSIGIITHELARRVAAAGCHVSVYARGWPGRPAEQHDGVDYRFVPGLDQVAKLTQAQTRLFASPVYHLDYALQVARSLRSGGYDLVVVHNFSQFVPIFRGASPRSHIALYMHCDWLSLLDPSKVGRRLRHADLILGVSDAVTDGIRRTASRYASRCATLHSGVDTQLFAPREREMDQAPPGLVFVGRISPEKGVHVLVDAFSRIADDYPDVELVLVGAESVVDKAMLVDLSRDPHIRALRRFYDGGGYLDAVRSQLSPSLARRLTVTGWLSRREVAEQCRRAAMCVNPSLSEAFGMGVAEAMSCGLAVVASRVGGIVDLVEEGTSGILVERDDAAALAAAIRRLLENEELRRRMGIAGRRRVVERFSWDRATERLLGLYDWTLAPGRGSGRGRRRSGWIARWARGAFQPRGSAALKSAASGRRGD